MLTAPQIEMDSEAAGHIKGQAYVKTDAKAKVPDAPAPTEAQAGGALVCGSGEVLPEMSLKAEAQAKAEAKAARAKAADAEAQAEAETARLAAEAEVAAEVEAAEAALATAKAKVKGGKGELTNNRASLRAASMLAQICERAFMEHQLAARHFTFYSFCEHVPVLRVCVMSVRVCPLVSPLPP